MLLPEWIKSLIIPSERPIKEIDQEVEEAVKEIRSTSFETVKGESILRQSPPDSGDTFFIMDLAPIYNVIGDRHGRLADSVAESCYRVFNSMCPAEKDRGVFEGDFFMMLFEDPDLEAGYLRAAKIINEIGEFILSDRFKAINIPDMLTAIKVNDITNRDGTINATRLEEKSLNGGMPIQLHEPPDNAPEWHKMLFEHHPKELKFVELDHEHKEENLNWSYITAGGNVQNFPRAMRDRRQIKMAITGHDRRKSFDRRGRGF
ncbi:MAG: hypothetical protein OQK24_08150 [Magnetovibrio sp.]|nr:hypothetical protein [Magnetovibrio sp.]